MSNEYPLMMVKKNGKPDPQFIRDYSNPKNLFKAIHKIVNAAGFEM